MGALRRSHGHGQDVGCHGGVLKSSTCLRPFRPSKDREFSVEKTVQACMATRSEAVNGSCELRLVPWSSLPK